MSPLARILELRIEALDEDGLGIAHHDGRDVRVRGVLPGGAVVARVVKRRRGTWFAVPIEGAVECICPAFPVCGGCSTQHLAATQQIEAKQRALLTRLDGQGVAPGRLDQAVLGPSFGYRRRARLGVRHLAGSGETLIGFRESFGSRIARARACPVLVPSLGKILSELHGEIGALSVCEHIPQIELAAGDSSAACIVRHLQPLTDTDIERLRAVASRSAAQVLTQSGDYSTVRGLDGEEPAPLAYRLDRFGLSYRFMATDFVQVNAAVNEALVSVATHHVAEPGTQVLDLFCGMGNFSLAMARRGATVIGLEGDAALVERARQNACLNRLDTVTRFAATDLYQVSTKLEWPSHDDARDRVLVDPPRSGLGPALSLLLAPRVERVVYVSCHPVSFASDAAALVAAGYGLSILQMFDMFPHTGHIETLGVFDRR